MSLTSAVCGRHLHHVRRFSLFATLSFLGKQQALITHLKNDGCKISDIRIGGEGNKEQGYGICLEVTGNWVQGVVKAGRLDFNKLEKKGFRRVKKVWKASQAL
jgi:hypothetical protein